MSRIGIIILSRYSSNRLPGKALMEIEGKAVLKYIIERLLQVVSADHILLATSDEVSDDPIAKFAKNEGIACYRGSLTNVAERFINAAISKDWEYAVRINGDNIFVDTFVLKEMISIAQNNNYDFISNVKGRTFPKGMSVEIAKVEYFRKNLEVINTEDRFKEHVMLYFYEADNGNYCYYYNTRLPEASGIQMALDTAEDFSRTKQIMSHFSKAHWLYNLKDIYSIWNTLHHE